MESDSPQLVQMESLTDVEGIGRENESEEYKERKLASYKRKIAKMGREN